MKEITLFVMAGCPYCRRAKQYLSELRSEKAEYAAVPVREIDENAESELAGSYDYYYVPSFYLGRTKLHEGAAEKEDVRRVLDAALAAK